MARSRKQGANWRRVAHSGAHCAAFVFLPQNLNVPIFAIASLTFCFLWISCQRVFEYWDEEWGFEFLEQVTPVQVLYPTTMVAEDIL